MCNVESIFIQAHMAIMRNVCISVILVMLLIAVSSYDACINWYSCLVSAHERNFICGICGEYFLLAHI